MASPSQQIILDEIEWEQYIRVSDAVTPQHGLRLTFDGQRLEFIVHSLLHERHKTMLGRLIAELTLDLNIDLESGGSTTLRREDVECGLEPDECFWVQHCRDMVGVSDWSPAMHPPPDLAVEIDVASSSLNRRKIYARLGVPELWLFDGNSLDALELRDAAVYQPIEYSLAFPFLRVAELRPFLLAEPRESETKTVRRFREWLRGQSLHPE